jgi:biopolymer transport protein ExbD
MIDVTFLLLIFFLVTTTFREAEGYFRSQLPRDSGASGSTLPISPVVVRLAPGDPEGITCAIRVDNVAHPPADFDALAAMLLDLQNRPGFDNETPVVIMANDDLPWNHVVDGWNAAVRANCKSIMFGG